MQILATGWAPTREAAIAFFEACLIAKLDAEAGWIIPIADVIVHPQRPYEEISITKIVDGDLIVSLGVSC